MRRLALGCLILAGTIWWPVTAADEPIDRQSIEKIRAEGLSPATSKVMEIASWLTDAYGPRLTGSPTLLQAADWSVAQMKAWGLENVALEPWPSSSDPAHPSNSFPRGWTNQKFYISVTAPQSFPLPGTPIAWTPGTKGVVRGEVVLVTETAQADLEAKYRGALKGKWILASAPPVVTPFFAPQAQRYTAEELERLASPAPPRRGGGPGRGAPGAPGQPSAGPGRETPPGPPFSRTEFFWREGSLGVLSTSARGHGLYTIGGASRTADPATMLPLVVIPAEQYGRIARLLEKNLKVTIEADIANTYHAKPPLFNVVGEIRGTDRANELVMLGAHFDSWHASTGATDNAAGAAAMLEAMRILKGTGVPLRRTVRLGLWTGEEQGLFGSVLYVQQHFGGGRGGRGVPAVARTPEHAALSGYFNIDNGTGAIRGVYLQQNEAVAPVFTAWMETVKDLGMTALSPRNTGGTDHTSFDGAGLPAWQFVQDPIEYDSMTHHTNLDSYERLQAEDMRKNATIAAIFALLAANRDELLPRKP